jgi:hypothetical protein
MVEPVGKGKEAHARQSENVPVQKIRVGYDSNTKTFKPLGPYENKKIKHLESVKDQVGKLSVPTDYTSGVILKGIKTEITCAGTRIDIETEGVNDFLSGNSANYQLFIRSIRTALQNM